MKYSNIKLSKRKAIIFGGSQCPICEVIKELLQTCKFNITFIDLEHMNDKQYANLLRLCGRICMAVILEVGNDKPVVFCGYEAIEKDMLNYLEEKGLLAVVQMKGGYRVI